MAESLTALGLASNIVQFLDFGYRLFCQSKELYESSQSLVNEAVELETIACSLRRLSTGLVVERPFELRPWSEDVNIDLELNEPLFTSTSQHEADLVLIARDCKQIAGELLNALDQLRIKGSRSKWQCFRGTRRRLMIWQNELNVLVAS